MSDAQKHDYATAPTGAHELPRELQPNADLHARLVRPSVGANDAEAVALIDALPELVIRSESDELLAQRVKTFRSEGGRVFDPAEHSVKVVLSHVGGDVNEAQAVLAAERDGKNRSTLIEKLSEVVDAAQINTPPVVAAAPASDDATHI